VLTHPEPFAGEAGAQQPAQIRLVIDDGDDLVHVAS
jgi:hypothetical protein